MSLSILPDLGIRKQPNLHGCILRKWTKCSSAFERCDLWCLAAAQPPHTTIPITMGDNVHHFLKFTQWNEWEKSWHENAVE
jgi:hypothetical protein